MLAAIGTLGAYALGALEPLERPLIDLRMQLMERPADPRPILIEIDARSIQEIGRWPWPRSLHALLLDRLTAAQAGDVFFDVDFSVATDEAEDAALEGALSRRQGRTVLAAFRQWSETASAYIDLAPLPRFAEHARLASVNAIPGADGRVHEMARSYPWRGTRLPSFAAAIAAAPPAEEGSFFIDFGIDPTTISRVSFVDVARGDIDPALLRGRPVVVGATAIELGDMLSAPIHRVLPGVMVQVLAAQSLMLDRALLRLPWWIIALAVPLFAALLAYCSLNCRAGTSLFIVALGNLIYWGAALGLQATAPVILDVVPFTLASFGACILSFLLRFRVVAANLVAESLARRRTENFMGAVAQNAFDALVTTDPKGRVRFINTAAGRMFGVKLSEATGLSIVDFTARPEALAGRDPGEVLQRMVRSGRPRRLVCRRSSGELFHADLTVSALTEGARQMFILLVRDIDRRVKAERRLRAREQELRRAKTEAELANKSKTEFLANMSHELRTPLNAIIGFSEMMKQQVLGPMGNKGYLTYADDIYESGRRLLETVSDVLEFSRIETDGTKLQEAEFDLVALCRRLAERLAPRTKKMGHAFNVYLQADEVRYFADERLIMLAMGHILGNAIKFTPEGGEITFILNLEDNGAVSMVIEDDGIGIEAAEIATCFEAFGQADRGLNRSHEGAGLGLTLAKRFIELHQGRIDLESAPGKGTRVRLSLPAARRRGAAARKSA